VLRFGGVLCPAATPVNGPDKLFEVLKSAHVHSKALSIAFVGFGGPFLAGGTGAFNEMMECAREATHIIATVPLPVEVTQIVSLNDIPDAIAASAKLGTKGKVIARF
jgi:hypothetical protein